MIKKENRISGIGLLGILLFISIISIVIGIIFEKYMINKEDKIFFRIILFTVLFNIIILFFLIFSFSKIKFIPGPKGSKGLIGRRGMRGKYDTVAKCKKQTKKLGEIYNEKLNQETIIVQRPVLGFNDKY
jgi:asparagine N-glycosylation enzyme membrane subunit Stt3